LCLRRLQKKSIGPLANNFSFWRLALVSFVAVGLALISFVALGLGMPIGNAVGNCVHKRTLKSGIALLLVVLGSYSLVYFVVNSQ
jgi:putative Mn2+ efflux pump MntP